MTDTTGTADTPKREPTPDQLRVCRNARLDPATAAWHGDHMLIDHWGSGELEQLVAIVNPSGSIAYFPEQMLPAALAGIPK